MDFVLSRRARWLTLAVMALLPLGAQAHRAWMLPSATVLSGNEPWVTVDAAVSNDLFYFEHTAMNLDGLTVFAPDGGKLSPENMGKGKFRSSFDLKLSQKGTYKLAVIGDSLQASYKLKGENKRLRGTAESLAKEIPADAEGLNVMRMQSRNEVFVTSGQPSDKVLQPTGTGLEMRPVTHPNDLVAGDAATFQFLLDGQALAGLEVMVIPGGIRYRDKLGEMRLLTDAQGQVRIQWPAAGMYYLTASQGAVRAQADAASAPLPAGSLQKPLRRASYVATLEVMAQ